MIYANDEIFNVKYNEKLDRLEIKQKGWTRVRQIMQNHKFITTVVIMFIVCCCMNCVLIYNFMEILKNF